MSIFKSIISPMQNCDEIAVRFCKQLTVKVTETSLKKEVTEHPDYPSLLSVSDALLTYKVENLSLKTTVNSFESFQTPFIVQVKGLTSQITLFAIINKILSNNTVNWYNPEKKKNEQISINDFEKLFTGYVMLAESDDDSGESDYEQNKKAETNRNFLNAAIVLALPVMLFFISGYSIFKHGISVTFFPIVYAIITLLGASTGALLLLFEVDQFNPTLQKVCHGGRKTNCNAILNSNAAHIWGISWSVIGFTYFSGILIALMMTDLVNNNMLSIVAIFNLFTLPYIFFSIYYQAKIAKQWCPMCLTVQAMLLLQFIIALVGDFYRIPSFVNNNYLFVCIISFVIIFSFVQILLPSLKKSKEGKFNQHELARLKHNPEIFKSLLEKQKKINESTEGLGITLGNPNAQIKVIKVCNPYCGPCSKAHQMIDDLINSNRDIHLRIIFTASGVEGDKRNNPSNHLLCIAKNGNENVLKQALDEWYLSEKKDYITFKNRYPIDSELLVNMTDVIAMNNWCEKVNIEFTPTFFINDYQLPNQYNVSDLKYFLSV